MDHYRRQRLKTRTVLAKNGNRDTIIRPGVENHEKLRLHDACRRTSTEWMRVDLQGRCQNVCGEACQRMQRENRFSRDSKVGKRR